MEPNCTSCHFKSNPEGITELESYPSLMSVQEWLQPLVFGITGNEIMPENQRMPPPKSRQPTAEEKALLLLWFADGMKE